MRMSTLLAPTLRDEPAEAEVVSHRLMLRAGLMRRVSAGIYTHLPLGNRVISKIENIVRQEMDSRAGQEVRLPIVQPAEMWHSTGRWQEYGEEMWKLKDRHDRQFCLGPTHEEITTSLLAAEVSSYRSLPVLVYQIQNKYRDEIRPRFGVMRSREFIMKDLYSFDRDEAGLDASYQAMHEAYSAVFDRCGLSYRAVSADPGPIGGDATQEFMALAETGEGVVIHCSSCGYAATSERAEAAVESTGRAPQAAAPTVVDTPGVRTIQELAALLGVPATETGKILFLWAVDGRGGSELVAVVIRGDRQLNQVKLKNYLGCSQLHLAAEEDVLAATGAPFGSAGPVGLRGARVVVDSEVAAGSALIVGANRQDAHLVDVVPGRDFPLEDVADLREARAGDRCPRCGESLAQQRGIEVGQIFKLGVKYAVDLNATYTDQDGLQRHMVMGCYGIGITRTMAAVIEQHHDSRGIVWPAAVAPMLVTVVPVNWGDARQRHAAEDVYLQLLDRGIEAVIDDRQDSAGVKFGDADLIGFPLRVTVGPRSLEQGQCEIKCRRSAAEWGVPLDRVADEVSGWKQPTG